MAENTELQKRYSQLVLAKQRKTSVFVNLFNRNYDGTPTAGAVQIPVRDKEVEVKDYDKVNGAELSTSTTSYITLPIDHDASVNELIDKHTAAAVPDNLVAERLDSAGYSMGLEIDTNLGNALLECTAIKDTAALTPETIYKAVINARTEARKAHLKSAEMWLAVSPDTYGLLLQCEKFTQASNLGDQTVQNGVVGKIAGISVYEVDNLSDETVDFILGNRIFCHYVDDWAVPVSVNDLADGKHIGACAVQGRNVYGYKVSKPTTVFVRKHV